MKIKTEILSGSALDWAVAKCEGVALDGEVLFLFDGEPGGYNYSSDWSQGGPIMERNRIHFVEERPGLFFGFKAIEHAYIQLSSASKPLIAAMRCHVASKLGNEVDVPDELAVLCVPAQQDGMSRERPRG